MQQFDICIVGSGIVGLATAFKILEHAPSTSVAIFEKEHEVAQHQTGHNSGVVHTGIYYKPGSLKAQNCIKGKKLLIDFCKEHQVPYKDTHKLITATSSDEIPRMEKLFERGKKNSLSQISLIEQDEISNYEPHLTGIGAILNTDVQIISYIQVSLKLKELLQKMGVSFFFNTKVKRLYESGNEVLVETGDETYSSNQAINCAGLYSDSFGHQSEYRIIPFRGEYFHLKRHDLVNGLIYPVPNPDLPFLGVHLTKMIDNSLEAGPNAVLALAREGYCKTTVNLEELFQTLSFRGFWKLSMQNFSTGLYEMYRSVSKHAFLKSLQKFVPALKIDDLSLPGSGVRAQLLRKDGKLCDDFVFETEGKILHVLNAPSPAATASLAIGETISSKILNYASP